ncbi:MAG TPA: hypothetical protein DIC34_02670 [Treponema sp.]|nr:MAG: hypothetical protein A2Y36_10575 [Treponema sp. GWA1_62_8]OHE66996.1 MAG: hypothetical protein A2001_08105 [Treponema sp. GWC1_61_84]HCM25446.1 hypothetical protein [Treponema sp.]
MIPVKRWTIAAALLLGCLAFAAAAEVDVAIRYFDKRVYYAGSDTGAILVQITVSNRGASTYRFKLADERAFSVDFDVRTMSNLPLEPTEIFTRKRNQDQPVFFREVSIQSGESISFTEDLRDYARLPAPGSYVVQARLYPELYRATSVPHLASNRLSLSLRPAPLAEAGSPPPALDVETGAVLVRRNMPPDQVVEYLLSARQKGQWEKFFLYLDLESMLGRDGGRKRAWTAESEEGRQRMLERYRADLRSAVVDGDIATIPIEFAVERTSYGADEGTVSVLEKFKFGTYMEKKRYTYNLRRRDDVWTVYDYTVINLGAE